MSWRSCAVRRVVRCSQRPFRMRPARRNIAPGRGRCLAVSRYYLGPAVVPPRRLSSHAGGAGARCDAVGPDRAGGGLWLSWCLRYLERLAAQGELIYQDDTVGADSVADGRKPSRFARKRRPWGYLAPTERTGMYTTALVVKVGERTICLYYSGRAHAGENLKALLEQRQAGLDKPLVMSDALSRNEADEDGADSLSLSGPWPAPVQRPGRRLSARSARSSSRRSSRSSTMTTRPVTSS